MQNLSTIVTGLTDVLAGDRQLKKERYRVFEYANRAGAPLSRARRPHHTFTTKASDDTWNIRGNSVWRGATVPASAQKELPRARLRLLGGEL